MGNILSRFSHLTAITVSDFYCDIYDRSHQDILAKLKTPWPLGHFFQVCSECSPVYQHPLASVYGGRFDRLSSVVDFDFCYRLSLPPLCKPSLANSGLRVDM